MSKFLDEFKTIVEKSLQRVMLRVDPRNRYAEDYTEYDGYVGYILAETDQSIDFFYANHTITIPKNAVVIEAAPGATSRFMQSLAGNAQDGKSGALGSIIRQVGSKVGQVYGLQPGQAQQAAPTTGSPGSNFRFPDTVDRSQGFRIIDREGIATINVANKPYGFMQIAGVNNPALKLTAESYKGIIADELSVLSEYKQIGYSGLTRPGQSQLQTTAGTQLQPTNPGARPINTEVLPPEQRPQQANQTAQKDPTTIDVDAQRVETFIKTRQLLANKLILSKQVVATIAPVDENNPGQTPLYHQGVFTRMPNSPEVVFTFLD